LVVQQGVIFTADQNAKDKGDSPPHVNEGIKMIGVARVPSRHFFLEVFERHNVHHGVHCEEAVDVVMVLKKGKSMRPCESLRPET
jgi:hypothetical protein